MTMRISGDKGLIQQATVKKARQQQNEGAAGKVKTEDKVSFSALLQQAGQAQGAAVVPQQQGVDGIQAAQLHHPTMVQDVAESVEVERSDKVAELKMQVADGSYQPDLKKVAASLLTFLAEGRKV